MKDRTFCMETRFNRGSITIIGFRSDDDGGHFIVSIPLASKNSVTSSAS